MHYLCTVSPTETFIIQQQGSTMDSVQFSGNNRLIDWWGPMERVCVWLHLKPLYSPCAICTWVGNSPQLVRRTKLAGAEVTWYTIQILDTIFKVYFPKWSAPPRRIAVYRCKPLNPSHVWIRKSLILPQISLLPNLDSLYQTLLLLNLSQEDLYQPHHF